MTIAGVQFICDFFETARTIHLALKIDEHPGFAAEK
jgi:hypothetical protein